MDAPQLSRQQLRLYKAAFSKYDSDKDGVVNSKQLGSILRHVGLNPTEAEIQVGIKCLVIFLAYKT